VNQSIPIVPVQPTTFDEITLEFVALREKVNVESNADGTKNIEDVQPGEPKTYTAKESLSLSYYKGFADLVELTLNGKKVEPPAAPARGNAISIAINKDNIKQFWDAGSFDPPVEQPSPEASLEGAATTPRPSASQTVAATPSSTVAPVRTPARTPSPTPRPTRTTIIVGNSTRSPSNRP
jgi:hypothetical protein